MIDSQRRRILVVTYYYPPQPGSGSNRWAAMTKYLRRMGHEVDVVTAAPPGHEASAADGVVRTANLNSNAHLRRVVLRRLERDASQDGAAGDGRVMPSWSWKLLVPDPWLATWIPYAAAALRRLQRVRSYDCLITSSPSESTHLLGLGRGRPAWVADFRDGWSFEPLRPPFPTAPQRALDALLERRVVRSAEAVVSVTRPIVDDLRTRLGVGAELITNGFDPELAGLEAPTPARATLVHTGPLLGPRGRDARPLFAALRRLLDADPGLPGRMQLLVAGRPEEDERALIEQAGVGALVRHLGYLPHAEALALQRSATALVLLTSHNRCEATGKLYEYLASGRPILALAEGTEAARIVRETGAGPVIDQDDVEAIAAGMRSALAGELPYSPQGIERYSYPALAQQMAAVIEAAIDRRSAGGARRASRRG